MTQRRAKVLFLIVSGLFAAAPVVTSFAGHPLSRWLLFVCLLASWAAGVFSNPGWWTR